MRFSRGIIVLLIIAAAVFLAYKMGYIGQAQKEVANSFDTHFNKGQMAYQTSKYEEAVAELNKAMELEPKNVRAPDALYRIGDCYRSMKQTDKAIASYQEVIKNYPEFKQRGQVEKSLETVRSLGR